MSLSLVSEPANDRTPISYRAFEASRNELWNNYRYERANPSREIATKSYLAEKPPRRSDHKYQYEEVPGEHSRIVETVSPDLTMYAANLTVNERKCFHMIIRGESLNLSDVYYASLVVDTDDVSLIEMIHEAFVEEFKKRGNMQETCKWLLSESHFASNKGSNGQSLLNLEKEFLPDPARQKANVA